MGVPLGSRAQLLGKLRPPGHLAWAGHLILGFDVNTDFIRHMPEKQCPVSRSLIPENSQAPAESQGLLQGGRAAGKLSEHSVAQQTER
jgi:hypothetical protein